MVVAAARAGTAALAAAAEVLVAEHSSFRLSIAAALSMTGEASRGSEL